MLGRTATTEGQPKAYHEEIMLFSYVENSYVANLGRTGRGNVNELRFYDHDNGYTFNAAEFSIKKDPSERYRLGWGVVITGGMDSQKNHSLGIFRDSDDGGPFFRNTAKYDLAEAYLSYLVPVGEGLTLKAGKWATLIGYEVYESPKNLNFSRSFLYTLGTPYFHTGLLATYPADEIRNGKRAVELAKNATALPGGEAPLVLRTLAAAYAEAGDFPNALNTAQRAIDLASAQNNTSLLATLRHEMELYSAHAAYRESPPQ